MIPSIMLNLEILSLGSLKDFSLLINILSWERCAMN